MIDVTKLLPEFRPLLAEDRLNELGPGSPNTAVRTQLQQLERELSASTKVRDHNFALACMAGLWLHHDFLDESHAISQDLHTAEGSYWHAIMHRREPDAWNSKYWFRRVGTHPVTKQLQEQSSALGFKYTDPFAFVDFAEQVRDTAAADEVLARKVQQLEWELLFDFCVRAGL